LKRDERTQRLCRLMSFRQTWTTSGSRKAKVCRPYLADVGLESPTYVIGFIVVIQILGQFGLFGNCRTDIAKNGR
jgi:hypothetical protein